MNIVHKSISIACLASLQTIAYGNRLQAYEYKSATNGMFTPTADNSTSTTSLEATLRQGVDYDTGSPSHRMDESIELPKNLRIKFVATRIANNIISGGGVDTHFTEPGAKGTWVLYENNTSIASVEAHDDTAPLAYLGNYAIPLPGPGEVFELGDNYSIYDALVFDGCGNVPVVPMEFRSMIRDLDIDDEILGEFSALDNTSLTPNGYWDFHYSIRAMDTDGGVSSFDFDGTVEVLCTNLEAY